MTTTQNTPSPLGIQGVGIDMVELNRIRSAIERYGERFSQRIFAPEEIQYCQSFADPIPHFAARFAAKEAVAKAFGTGIGPLLKWKDIATLNQSTGQPYVSAGPTLQNLLRQRRIRTILLSLSHSREYAIAVAILIG